MLNYLKISFGSAAIVIASIWTLCFIANLNAKNTSYKPIAFNKKETTCRPSQIIPSNDQRLQPRILENQTDNFDYTFGRKILKEQQERYLLNWKAQENLTWEITHCPEGKYKIVIKYKSQQNTLITGNAFGNSFQIKLPKSDDWKTYSHSIQLSTIHSRLLSIQHTSDSMDLMSLTLKK